MELKSVSGTRLYVKDLAISIAYYERLGFRPGNQTDTSATFYLNWYSVELIKADPEKFNNALSGMHMLLKVDGIQEAHDLLSKEGFNPNGTPEKKPSGATEFTVTDPDGHTLVFFDK